MNKFCQNIRPSMISIDYNINPKTVIDKTDIPIQGGLDPKVLLSDKESRNLTVPSLLFLIN